MLGAVESLRVAPGSLFMLALVLRDVQPALQTGRVVTWSGHHLILGLYVRLAAMPLAALLIGSTAIHNSWRNDLRLRVPPRTC